MRYSTALLLLGVGNVAAQSMTKCLADNCLRAIRASAFPSRSVSADCSSFFQSLTTSTTTTTQTTVISESTTLPTVTITLPLVTTELAKRQVPPPAPTIPAYASACSGIARYSSACACIGVTETAGAATSTVTETTTTTISYIPTATVTSFVIKFQNNGNTSPYFRADAGGGTGFVADISQATVYYLYPDGHIESNAGIPRTCCVAGASFIYNGGGSFPLSCQIGQDYFLTCQAGGYTLFGIQGGSVFMGKVGITWAAWGVGPIPVKAVPPPV
ncbi:hypothetical protein TWF281_007400 [Arthrobotrys megalospora]